MDILSSRHDCLRNELLPGTISVAAATSPFYKERYADVDVSKIRSIADLPMLPIIYKDDITRARERIRCNAGTIGYVQNTSGSTGAPLLIYRSVEEVEFIGQCFQTILEPSLPKSRPLILSVDTPHHGTPTPIPVIPFVLRSPVGDGETTDHCIRWLKTSFEIPGVDARISGIAGSDSEVALLTGYVLSKGHSPSEFSVSHVFTTSRYITRRWRRVISEAWGGARVCDRYSLSEIFGGAYLCPICEGYHFDPHVIPELVDIASKAPVDEGVGMMVLTSLRPFVQLTPFIRYWTGDLFRKQNEGCHSPSYIFMGRVNHALFDPRIPGRLLLSGVDLIEALDSLPTIRRLQHRQSVSGNSYEELTGRPIGRGRFWMTPAGIRAELQVELTFDPRFFPEASAAIQDALRSALCASSKVLTADIDAGRVDLEISVLPPGTLDFHGDPSLEKRVRFWEAADAS